jgi:hypothetical protein
VLVGVGVAVGVWVDVAVAVAVGVFVGVWVAVGVCVDVAVAVAVGALAVCVAKTSAAIRVSSVPGSAVGGAHAPKRHANRQTVSDTVTRFICRASLLYQGE